MGYLPRNLTRQWLRVFLRILPPQPPLTKGGIKRGLLIKGGLNPKITLPSVLMMMSATHL